jgi:preprotein translocase subunit SecF
MRHLRLVPEKTSFDFMRHTRIWLLISAVALVCSIGLILTRGLNFGVDFRGGTLIMVETPEEEPVADFRAALTALDFGEVGVTQISDDSGAGRHMMLMRLGVAGDDPDAQGAVIQRIRTELTTTFPGIAFLQVDSVGAKVSSELVTNGVLAVLLSFIGIMFYVWLRFEWQFALGAVVALLHDAILTVGLFSLLQLEFNLTIVAAILTVIGYSINDTVVIFDRMRENLRKYKTTPLKDVLNLALNESLARTIMTSMTTLLALLAIYFFGGEVISGFALAVIFGGVISGTYSTTFIAGAIVLWLGVKRDWSKTGPAKGTRFGDVKA